MRSRTSLSREAAVTDRIDEARRSVREARPFHPSKCPVNHATGNRESGQGTLEYVLAAIVIGLIVLFIVARFGGATSGRYNCASGTVDSAKVVVSGESPVKPGCDEATVAAASAPPPEDQPLPQVSQAPPPAAQPPAPAPQAVQAPPPPPIAAPCTGGVRFVNGVEVSCG